MKNDKIEYATTDRDNTYVGKMLRIVRSLGRNLEGRHEFTPEEIEKERLRLADLDAYYEILEEKMRQAHKS